MAIKLAHEYLPRPVVVSFPCRDVVKPHALELEEQRQVGLKMGLGTVEAFKARINEREGHHRGRRGVRQQIHWELVDEIAIGMPLADGTGVTLCRQIFLVDAELLGEETDLLRL